MTEALAHKRVLLKVSGEALMGAQGYGLDASAIRRLGEEIIVVHNLGVEVCLVIGGGNIFRGMSRAAAAIETGCDLLLKGTQVDGVYSADPKTDPSAVRYERLSYHDVVARNLRVMDTSAIALARDNKLPIVVFSIHKPGTFANVVQGAGRFTTISEGECVLG
jgi:uridylate kinase